MKASVIDKDCSSIPIFDARTLSIDSDFSAKSNLVCQGSPLVSRLPSLKPKANRQRLSLSTRKCVSSTVTPISSPVIPKSTNNNLRRRISSNKLGADVIESSRLINDIDATLSQLSHRYYTDNNNLTEVLYPPFNDEGITQTHQRNNNCISHVSNNDNMLNKSKLKKSEINVSSGDVLSPPTPKLIVKQSHIPNLSRENIKQKSPQSRPTKLQFANERNNFVELNGNSLPKFTYKSIKSSTTKKSKSSNLNYVKPSENLHNSNMTYTEAWIYNSRLVNHNQSHDLQNVAKDNTCALQNCQKSYPPHPNSSKNSGLFHKAIFNQHRHTNNATIPSEVMPISADIPKIPVPSKIVKNNKDELNANRDSGISSSSCSKESWVDLVTEMKLSSNHNNNNTVSVNLPQPPLRISSLAQGSINVTCGSPSLSNQSFLNKDYFLTYLGKNKSASKADRRKARELFASVKQRDEQRIKTVKADIVKFMDKKNNGTEYNHADDEIKPKLTEIGKEESVETPNSDLENGMAEGYCSDMDNFKNSGYCSDNSGYMSEGSLGLYAQKMQQRFKEGLLAVQESLKLTSNNKTINRKFESIKRDDLSTSSEEIEDYLKELSNRLGSPVISDLSETKQNIESCLQNRKNILKNQIINQKNFEMQRKNQIYQERLEKYACDVEPAADFDITSSCSMDLLTGKAISDVGSEEQTPEYKDYFNNCRRVSDFQVNSTLLNFGNVRKSSQHQMESIGKIKYFGINNVKSGEHEILEAAGPTPAVFDDDAGLRLKERGNYRAMSLPGRQKRVNEWEIDISSLSRNQANHLYPLPKVPVNNTNIYYDVPNCDTKKIKTNENGTHSLMNIRLPYARVSQGVKPSISTYSLGKKDENSEDVYDGLGSHLSLLSNASHRSFNEERQMNEIRKLRRELEIAQQKVKTLSGQLSNNGNLVTAFENSLQSMSLRLQRFAASSESKESELNDLKNTIESLKKQASTTPKYSDQNIGKIYSASSLTSLISNSNSNEKRSEGSNKKSSWLKNSLGKAFRKKSTKDEGSTESINNIHKKQMENGNFASQSITESESLHALKKELEEKDARLTDVQLDALSRSHQLEQLRDILTKMRYEMLSLKADNNRLQNLMILSNAGVSSPPLDQSMNNDSLDQLDHPSSLKNIPKIKDFSNKPKFDFLNALVKDEEACQVVMVYVVINNKNKSLTYQSISGVSNEKTSIPIGRVGVTSVTSWSDLENNLRHLVKEYMAALDAFSSLGLSGESISRYRINNEAFISVCNTGNMRPLTSPFILCSHKSSSKIYLELKNYLYNNSIDDMVFDCLIPKSILQRYFGLLIEHKRVILSGPSGTGKTYLAYKLAENIAYRNNREPSTSIILFNVDHKSTKELRSYMLNLTEQLLKCDPQNDFNITSTPNLPLVIILDNLHHVSSFSEIFNSFLSVQHIRSPFIIGTMSQSNSPNNKNLQLHHNFRWILCTNHMEPVKGYLGRFLRRQSLKHQLETGLPNDQLYYIIEWVYIVWQHINRFLETYSSADVTIGPRLFLNCPMDVGNVKTWFIDLWNYSVVPYIIEAVREGLTVHGRKQVTWDDPTDWIIRSWPWTDLHGSLCISNTPADQSNLIKLRPEDVGFDSYQIIATPSDNIGPYSVTSHLGIDLNSNRLPSAVERRLRYGEKSDNSESLINMLMKMQEKSIKKLDI